MMLSRDFVPSKLHRLHLGFQSNHNPRDQIMSAILRKRRRPDHNPPSSPDRAETEADVRAKFQRAFESKFRPLSPVRDSKAKVSSLVSSSDSECCLDESEFEGFSDVGGAHVEVFDSSHERIDDGQISENERRAFYGMFLLIFSLVRANYCSRNHAVRQPAHESKSPCSPTGHKS